MYGKLSIPILCSVLDGHMTARSSRMVMVAHSGQQTYSPLSIDRNNIWIIFSNRLEPGLRRSGVYVAISLIGARMLAFAT